MRSLVKASAAVVCAAAVVVPLALAGGNSDLHGRPLRTAKTSPLTHLVAQDLSATVASGSYDMTFSHTVTSPASCVPSGVEAGQGCGTSAFQDITGHGTVNTGPFAMVAVSQIGGYGTISLYENGTDVWELGGDDYGLSPGDTQAGPGSPLSGFASSVEGSLGPVAGALAMQGLASAGGYLDLESQEIEHASPAGTGTVDGVPVTIYRLSVTGVQDPNLSRLTPEQVTTIQSADAILKTNGFSGETVWVSVDADGYIREQRTQAALPTGGTVTDDNVFSDFGCAGTVLMPGQQGSSTPPAGCVSPDQAGSGLASTPSGSTTLPSTTVPSATVPSMTVPSTTEPPPTITPSTTAPATTTTTSPSANGTSPSTNPSTGVVLGPDGLGVVQTGDPESVVTGTLSHYLGAPTAEPAAVCTGRTEVEWDDLALEFSDGQFTGYRYLPGGLGANREGSDQPTGPATPALLTAAGATLGTTLSELQALHEPGSLTAAQGGSFVEDGAKAGDRLALELGGTTPTSPVVEIKGGSTCGDV